MSDLPRTIDEPLKGELKPSELACKECDGRVAVDCRRVLTEYAARVCYSCGEGHVAVQVIRSPLGERGVNHELQGLRRVRTTANFTPVFISGRKLQGD